MSISTGSWDYNYNIKFSTLNERLSVANVMGIIQ